MKQIWQRITSETPMFFKKIRAIGYSLVGLKASLLVIPDLPAKLTDIATQAAIIGGVMIAIAQMTATNPPEQK